MSEKILVAYATKRGSTAEIAARIAEGLKKKGYDVVLEDVKEVGDPSGYGRIVLGSALYMGFWRKEMVRFLKKHARTLETRPTWLFCTGPTDHGNPKELLDGRLYPDSLKPILDTINPEEVTCFGGKLDPERMSFFDRKIIEKVKAPIGDFRDWGAIDAFVDRIAGFSEDA